MRTETSPSHEPDCSGGQGVGGNRESAGLDPQARRPEENEPATSSPAEGRPSAKLGKPYVANGGVVCEASMCVWSLHGDLGKLSVLRTVRMREARGGDPRGEWPRGRER